MTVNPTRQMALDGILGNSHRDEKGTIDATLSSIILTDSRAGGYQH
jgi:hypothetical protein